MAGVVFRPYWFDGERRYVAVLGDVSLDAVLRGRGIGRQLMGYVTDHLRTKHAETDGGGGEPACCFVIPNEALSACLLSCGWEASKSFVWYVWVIDPTYKLDRFLGGRTTPAPARELLRRMSALRLLARRSRELALARVPQVGDAFDRLWERVAKSNMVLRERSAASLRWRYETHPEQAYEFWTVEERAKMVGYLICSYDGHGTCWVNDLLALRTEHLGSMMRAFLREQSRNRKTRVVRMKLNPNHPYDRELLHCGFIRRSYRDAYQVCWLDRSAREAGTRWFLSAGDKDT
jgi:hypothetical protein